MPDRTEPRLGGETLAMPPSLWAATAPAPPSTVPLAGREEADVVIVGGGYTGLSAAIHLAERGVSVVVVEAAEIGWGASGRNNGQVIPGLKLDPDEVESHLGRDVGSRLVDWAGRAPGYVFDLVKKHGMDCHAVNAGWIQPAYTRSALPSIEKRCAQWARRGAPVEMLDPADLPGMLGTNAFRSAWIDRRGGTIQPLAYARSLAAAAIAIGARVRTRSHVLGISKEGGRWTVRTSGGTAEGKHLVVATNAYSGDLVGGMRQTIVPVRTAQVATRPLGDSFRKVILPGGQGASDTRRLLTSFRLSPDGRLVMGGSGATGAMHRVALERHLHRSANELFAHLGHLEWEYGWSGYLAITIDHLPHLHEPQEGLHVAMGCNGRGIALTTSFGRILADRITDRDRAEPVLPVTSFKNVSFHAFRNVGIASATVWKRMQDRRDRRRSAYREALAPPSDKA